MKTVGIITYHRAHNYGAVLQCFALQEILKSLGHEVCIIDYRQPFIEKLYNPSKSSQIVKQIFHPRNLLKLKEAFLYQDLQARIYEQFRNSYLIESVPCDADNLPKLDYYLVGSDQMWSIDCVGKYVDPVYFGQFNRPAHSKLVGFSISSNEYSLSRLSDNLKEFSSHFDNISFRENSIATCVNSKLKTKYLVTLDPTLCADSSIWNNLININDEWSAQKYIVLYHVKLRFAPIIHRILLDQANRIAKIHGLEIIDLSNNQYSVSDFVSIIKNAQYVLTTSFHATVFSIIFNKPLFCVKLHDGHDDRYIDLLCKLNAEQFLFDLDFKDIIPPQLDYKEINTQLNELRLPSIEYLKTNIK